MKSDYLNNGWSFSRLIATCLITAAIITGCGLDTGNDTSAGVGTGGTGSLAKTITGKVADGYLVNVTVFLDKNGNYQLDAGEPSTTTDANGAYTLNVDPADVGKYPIVALAIKGVAVDKDTNQTVANSYVLSMPKESVSDTVSTNFISPLTSQLREIMETGIFNSIQQAADALRTKIGLPVGTDMQSDYIAANNTAMHSAAQNISALMGNQMEAVLGTNGSTTTVDVNRYRGMMGTIFSNLSSVRGSSVQTGMTDPSSPMSNLNNTLTTVLPTVPPMSVGQPYKNMSTAFRGMMGGVNTIIGGMK
jgi:hypothetical protein